MPAPQGRQTRWEKDKKTITLKDLTGQVVVTAMYETKETFCHEYRNLIPQKR
jgi:hypothetical protein